MALTLSLMFPASAAGAELKKKTIEAFDHYMRLSEARIDEELRRASPFLWVDSLPEPRRAAAYAQLRQGQVVIEKLKTFDQGKEIKIPDGMSHHWAGAVFIPGATLQQTLALVQDYDRHQEYYKPEVMRSKLRERTGDDFKIYLRFLKKKFLTAVLNTHHDVHYFTVDATRAHSRSYTTRIAEVADPGEPDEREKPVGKDRGFLWRLNTYWRFEERDGGTYVECESISLSRDLPPIIGPLIRGTIEDISRGSLNFTLATTRSTVMNRVAAQAR